MSTQCLQDVLSRAMADSAFADLLFSDPDQALASYDLSPDEVAALKSMSRTTIEQLSKALPEDRKSFSIFIDR
jgi:hypothetical protein